MRLYFQPILELTVAAAVVFALLMGLGIWQIERLHWKLNLIAMMNRNMHIRPISLDDNGRLVEEVYTQYRHVTVRGRFENAKETYLFTTGPDGGPAYHVLTPFITDNGRVYLIDRGLVPKEKLNPASRRAGFIEGETRLTGIWRWPERPGLFAPTPDFTRRIFYARDIAAIAAVDHVWFAQPGLIEADAKPNPGGWPKGGQTVVRFRNRHLQYAITWFALAGGLLLVYLAYHRAQGRLGFR